MSIPYRNPVVHDTNESKFPSPYELTDNALKNYGISRQKFGSTEVELPGGKSFIVKDYQYKLPDGSVGMHFIPINDKGSVTDAEGNQQDGHFIIDQFLRQKMKLKESETIFAFINYMHPEQNKGTIQELLTSPTSDKIEMGFTHLGAYYGNGYTTNAPMLYHSHKFGVDGTANETVFGYPCNVQIICLDGVDQVTLNNNLTYVDTCLNAGVMFPNRSALAYKDSKFRTVDINTSLMFYRDWIRFKIYLKTDHSWYTYCAAHKTIVANVALNLPHNLKSFQEVYGKKEGSIFWEEFKLYYNSYIGPDPGFLPINETYFEPLWKMQGFTAEQISPFTYKEYRAYDKARLKGKLKSFKGKKALLPSEATAWAPQVAAEIIYDIVQTYADMLDAGSVMASATILGFMEQIDDRMGISKLQYLMHAMPLVEKLMIADASISAAKDPENYLANTFKELFAAFGGKSGEEGDVKEEIKKLKGFSGLKQILKEFLKGELMPGAIAAWSLLGVVTHWESIIKAGTIDPIKAYETMMESIQGDLEKAREMHITDPKKVQFNAPPATAHLISNGLYQAGKFVSVQGVCTVIDHTESQIKKK